jgi:hypothetical protein
LKSLTSDEPLTDPLNWYWAADRTSSRLASIAHHCWFNDQSLALSGLSEAEVADVGEWHEKEVKRRLFNRFQDLLTNREVDSRPESEPLAIGPSIVKQQ